MLTIQKNLMWSFTRLLALFALAFSLLTGCATKEKNEFAGWSVDRLYTEGRDQMIAGDYTRAAQVLEATIAQYPFSAQATQAQLELPYVYWKDENKTKALAAADRFITLNGSHPKLDYMYYLKGIINYNQNTGFLKALITKDVSGARDPKAASEAFESFKTLVTKFPGSRYAPDARKRMIEVVDTLARQELAVARYYYDRDAYLAAINRAQSVLQNFDGTPAVEPALIIIANSYDALKMPEMRDDTLNVLHSNFPNSTGKLDAARQSSWKFWKKSNKAPVPNAAPAKELAPADVPKPE